MIRHGRLRRYGFAVLVILLGMQVLTIPTFRQGTGTPALIAFFAIMMSAWYGGLGPGLVTTALVAYIATRSIFSLGGAVGLALWLGGGAGISLMIEALHVARRRAEESEGRQRSIVEELERSREALNEAKEAAEAANRAKDQFLAMLSHELRTPLTPVLATISHIESLPDLPDGLRDDLASIRRNVGLEARLINDLLDITRLSRGEFGLAREVVDVHATLKAALEICRSEAEANGIFVSLALRARDHHSWVDPERLQQVFWNLIGNAVKFTPDGGHIRLSTTNPVGGRIAVVVSDTGIGIDPEFLPCIFEAFEQAGQPTSRRQGGLGLGLAIARKLVDLQGGSMTAASGGLGTGAAFTVELTTSPAPEAANQGGMRPAPAVAMPEADVVEEEPAEEAKALKLLLVEDNADTLQAMSQLLKASGFAVQAAASVEAAMDATAEDRFDLMVSDIGLPDGSGLDVMRHVKDRYGLKGIAFSGYGTDEDVQASREAGFEHHLTKPIDVRTLVDLIRRTAS